MTETLKTWCFFGFILVTIYLIMDTFKIKATTLWVGLLLWWFLNAGAIVAFGADSSIGLEQGTHNPLVVGSNPTRPTNAGVVELVDITDSKSVGIRHEGSTPFPSTNSPWWIIVSGRSWHEVDKDYEETNWGLGFEYKHNSRWSTIGGTYRNSFGNQTYYLGEVYSPDFLQFTIREMHVKPGLLAGLLTGYSNRVVVAVLPTLQVEISEKVGMDVLFGCKDLKCKEGVIGLSFKFNKGVLE